MNFSPQNTAVCSRHSKTGQVNKLMMHVCLFKLMRDDLSVHPKCSFVSAITNLLQQFSFSEYLLQENLQLLSD